MTPPRVAGVEIPPIKLHELTERQLAQMTPFERDTCRRLGQLERRQLELLEVLETFGKRQENAKRELLDHTKTEARASRRRTWWATGTTGTVIVAALGLAGTLWQGKIARDIAVTTQGAVDSKVRTSDRDIEARMAAERAETIRELRRQEREEALRNPAPLGTGTRTR